MWESNWYGEAHDALSKWVTAQQEEGGSGGPGVKVVLENMPDAHKAREKIWVPFLLKNLEVVRWGVGAMGGCYGWLLWVVAMGLGRLLHRHRWRRCCGCCRPWWWVWAAHRCTSDSCSTQGLTQIIPGRHDRLRILPPPPPDTSVGPL